METAGNDDKTTETDAALSNAKRKVATTSSWAPILFWATLAGILVFFWWLLIYSHGVEVHHG